MSIQPQTESDSDMDFEKQPQHIRFGDSDSEPEGYFTPSKEPRDPMNEGNHEYARHGLSFSDDSDLDDVHAYFTPTKKILDAPMKKMKKKITRNNSDKLTKRELFPKKNGTHANDTIDEYTHKLNEEIDYLYRLTSLVRCSFFPFTNHTFCLT